MRPVALQLRATAEGATPPEPRGRQLFRRDHGQHPEKLAEQLSAPDRQGGRRHPTGHRHNRRQRRQIYREPPWLQLPRQHARGEVQRCRIRCGGRYGLPTFARFAEIGRSQGPSARAQGAPSNHRLSARPAVGGIRLPRRSAQPDRPRADAGDLLTPDARHRRRTAR